MVVETPVPIPNTVVKHSQPMIVKAFAKVGIAKFYKPRQGEIPDEVFLCAVLHLNSIPAGIRSERGFFVAIRPVMLCLEKPILP